MSNTSLTTVLDFVLSSASKDDLDAIYAAAKARTKNLRTIAGAAALSMTRGTPVRLDGLSPRYLNGLTGTFNGVGPNGRLIVDLDEASTSALRWGPGARRFHIAEGTTSYKMGGLPASTVHPA